MGLIVKGDFQLWADRYAVAAVDFRYVRKDHDDDSENEHGHTQTRGLTSEDEHEHGHKFPARLEEADENHIGEPEPFANVSVEDLEYRREHEHHNPWPVGDGFYRIIPACHKTAKLAKTKMFLTSLIEFFNCVRVHDLVCQCTRHVLLRSRGAMAFDLHKLHLGNVTGPC